IVCTRCSSTIQKVKKIALLSAIKLACIRNAPRCAIAAARLVRARASAKRAVPAGVRVLVSVVVMGLPSVELKRPRRALEQEERDDGCGDELQRAKERARQDERCWSGEQRRKGRECGNSYDDIWIERQWQEQAAEHERQLLPYPIDGRDVAQPEGEHPERRVPDRHRDDRQRA